ncbi:unnamed protein product (macronuclear) [Paramecium tetraurelia]|uniref:Uncharacterized protein n=1 Tax=Paramecium tetraurelia TaxID=5888 RepID=A0DF51_PARTE|nr:uncharacterized protein GSPATT00016481001 [Paramecium tetraurelia]CAK81668.1 unnamed protein product [Paramecium tetraurelia]|eukprot:XP_001449065.1 hypothetical protein (macronuclear) [Paramecium tetraurelia strain d4-2]
MEELKIYCQRVIQISSDTVNSELEILKKKESNLVQDYDIGNVDELDEQVSQNEVNQLIIHFRNYKLHNYLYKIRLVTKILQHSEKIFQRIQNPQSQLESYFGDLIATLEYIQQKQINYQCLKELKQQIDNLLNQQILQTRYQVSLIVLDIFNLKILRDIYLTEFYQKYGIEIQNYYKTHRKLSFDFQDENNSRQIEESNLFQETEIKKQPKKTKSNIQIITSPDTGINSEQHPISVKNSKNAQSKSDIRINSMQIPSPQINGQKSPFSNIKKSYFSSQLKIENQQNNYSIVEQIIQKKKNGGSDRFKKDESNEMFDEQSLFILRSYIDSKFTSNRINRTNDLAKMINDQQIK